MAVVVDRIAGGGGVSIPVSLTTSTGATTTEGILLGATNTATSGAQVFSPALHFQGSGWKTTATAAAQSCDWVTELQPVQGTTLPTNNLHFLYSINGAAYSSAGYWCSKISMTFDQEGLVADTIHSTNGIITAGTATQTAFMIEFAAQNIILGNSSATFCWSSSATSDPTTLRNGKDTGLSRISAGVVGVGTGAAGSVAGTISATSHMRVPLTVATLPAGATRGYTCIVTDASNPTFLATVVGGASTVTPVFYDGAAWKVG